ncbi:efflux transporter outer membrane subunit [Methylocella silvestris]|uniref:Transporter n=1 Tax=Methylocella silvestris TaxID=199596 RepID=A0A2J7TKG4_METSI|nr:efflux transporter outer membrane subunit [Methylocella silvestris]PNG27248.1 transporter [Methylocella silvestris]
MTLRAPFPALASIAALAVGLCGCAVGPDYVKPSAPTPIRYKELKGWKTATPLDGADRGQWWAPFRDKTLDSLISQVSISNQNVIGAEGAYRTAKSLVREAQAGLFPTVSVNYSGTGAHSGSKTSGFNTGSSSTLFTSDLTANASWTPDIWGQVRRSIENNAAGAQLSAADLANTTLSSQSLLATAYFNLRASDALKDLLERTAKEFQRTLEITQRQYAAGTVSKADVATAQAQLYNTQAEAINAGIARAQYEHAIAVLIGRPPAELNIAVAPFKMTPPTVPVSLPSVLLERRPDIASAERSMQAQNALIGVAIAAYYPDISLSGAFGFAGRGPLAVSLANEAWSVGVAAAQTVFDGGLRSATVDAARATYDQSVANYRQTVLSAFQGVEDQLVALRLLAQQAKVQDDAVRAAQEEVDVLLNQYSAGTVAFTAVVVAQSQLLTNQTSALTIRQNRFLATVQLIEALGGGWDVRQLPAITDLEDSNPLLPRL